jgi:hypothetical protein
MGINNFLRIPYNRSCSCQVFIVAKCCSIDVGPLLNFHLLLLLEMSPQIIAHSCVDTEQYGFCLSMSFNTADGIESDAMKMDMNA